jgi:hypothetical protein
MEENTSVIKASENYIHLRTEVVPDWVKNLETLKLKIRAELENPSSESKNGIKFCHPIDVPSKENQ